MDGAIPCASRRSRSLQCLVVVLWAHAVLPVSSSSECADDRDTIDEFMQRLGIPSRSHIHPCSLLKNPGVVAAVQEIIGWVLNCELLTRDACLSVTTEEVCDVYPVGHRMWDICCDTCMQLSGNGTDVWGSERDALRQVMLQIGISPDTMQGDDPCAWGFTETIIDQAVACSGMDDEGPIYSLAPGLQERLTPYPLRPVHSAIGELRGLRRLAIETVAGELPQSMGRLRGLQELWLRGQGITRTRDVLSNLTSLIRLQFIEDDLTEVHSFDSILSDISRFANLEILYLQGPWLSTLSADFFAGNPRLRFVRMELCHSGTLPRIAHLESLESFTLISHPRCHEASRLTDVASGGLPCFPGQMYGIRLSWVSHGLPWPDDWRHADCVESLTLEGDVFDGFPRWGRPDEAAEEAMVLAGSEDQRTQCRASQATDAPKFGRLRTLEVHQVTTISMVEDLLAFARNAPRLDSVRCANCQLGRWSFARGDDLTDELFYLVPSLRNTSQGLECESELLKAQWRTFDLGGSPLLGCDVVCAVKTEGPELKCFHCPRFSILDPSFSAPHSGFQICQCMDGFETHTLANGCPEGGNAVLCGCANKKHLRASECRPCSEEITCTWSDPQASLKEPETKAGYWAAGTADCAEPLRIFSCKDEIMCQPPAQQPECGGVLTQCVDGRFDIACARCLPGRVGGATGSCVECDRDSAPHIIAAITVGIVVALCVMLQVNVKQGQASTRSSAVRGRCGKAAGNNAAGVDIGLLGGSGASFFAAAAGQVLKFAQTMNVVSQFDLVLPEVNVIAFRPFQLVSLADVDVGMAFQCLTDGSFRSAAISWWLLPWVITVLCIPAYGLSKLLWLAQRVLPLEKQKILKAGALDGLACVLWLWSTFFNMILQRSMTFFNCVGHPGGDSTHIEHYYELCDSDEYRFLLPFAVAFAVLNIGVGLANVVYLVVVLGMRPGIHRVVKQAYHGVYSLFHHQAFFWMAVVAAKDLSMVAISSAIESASMQGFMSVLVLTMYLLALAQFQPFSNMVLTRLEMMLNVLLICTAQLSCAAFAPGSMTEEEKAARSALLLKVQVASVALPAIVLILVALPGLLGERYEETILRLLQLPPFSILGFSDSTANLSQAERFFSRIKGANEEELQKLIDRFDAHELNIFNGSFLRSLQNIAVGYHHKHKFNGRIFDDADTPVLFSHFSANEEQTRPRASEELDRASRGAAALPPCDTDAPHPRADLAVGEAAVSHASCDEAAGGHIPPNAVLDPVVPASDPAQPAQSLWL